MVLLAERGIDVSKRTVLPCEVDVGQDSSVSTTSMSAPRLAPE